MDATDRLERNSMVLEWHSLLKEALQRKCYNATEKLLSVSSFLINTTPKDSCHVKLRAHNQEVSIENNNNNKRKASNLSLSCDERNSLSSSRDDEYAALAVKTNDARFIKLFHAYNYTIDPPHEMDCKCLSCKSNQLGQSKKRISTLQVLSNPIWIGLTSSDPFLTSFQITKKCRIFSSFQDCYEEVYRKIIKQNKDFCCALLDHVENEAEVQCLMKRNHEKFYPFGNVKDLDFIRLGIQYKQKEVVAHSVSQYVITSIVNEGVPGWKTGTLLYRLFLIGVIGLTYPVTSLVHIIRPSSFIGQLAIKPLVKFINGAASFMTWLALVASLSTSPKSGIRVGDHPTVMEIVIFAWLFSLLIQEINELKGVGKREYLGSGWNWIDINMIVLMMSAYIMWIIIYFMNPLHRDKSFVFIISIADSCFALAIIFSYFRMMYLCQITRYLGLLQLCLGRMIQVILQFAFISVVVLGSFSVGMVFLFHASSKYEETAAMLTERMKNETYMDFILAGGYNGFVTTMITLSWASLTMIGRESLQDLNDGTLIQILSYALFTLYHCITMIVLLNMLIAMMSNSYQQIENNIEVEHKYARTHLWLQYIGDNNRLPCPFNFLPSYTTCKKLFNSMNCCLSAANIEKKQQEKQRRKSSQRDRYKELCETLMDRYIKDRYQISLGQILLTSASRSEAEDNLFHKMVNEKVKTWSEIFCSSNGNEVNNHYELCNTATYDGEVLCNHGAEIHEESVTTEHSPDTKL